MMKQVNWADGTTGKITAQGKSLEFACYGPDPSVAPTIIMLHEGLGSVGLWREFPRKMAETTGYGVFCYSRAGHGFSDLGELPRPLDYMTIEATEILPDVLSAVGFKSGILMGHSDGATIAAVYAGSIEDYRIRGLVLIAPHFFTEPMGLAAISKAKTDFEVGDLKVRMDKYHANAEHTFRGWSNAWLDPDFVDWNVGDAIDHLRIPVLAVQGKADEYGTVAQIDEIVSRIYAPLDTVMLDGCGHAPHLEQAVLTLDAVAEFTARLSRIENEVVKIA